VRRLSSCKRGAGKGAIAAFLGLLTTGAAVAAGTGGAAPYRQLFRDDLGHAVQLTQPPQRIVSLLPSLTETVCALDACARLVATDRFSNWPAAVTALPKVGGLDDVQIEAIVRLKPDLVLLSRSQRIGERLAQLGVASFALDSERYASIARSVEALGALLGEPGRATLLEQRIDSEVETITARARAERHSTPSVYFEVDRGPYAAGPSSFIGELLARLGARNIVDGSLGPFPKLNPEYVVRRDPDIVIVKASDAPHLAERPGWAALRAVRERHLCSFDDEVRDTIVRPGPRVTAGLQALAACLARWSP
jgi:iron complex transport system substrate-binding protein